MLSVDAGYTVAAGVREEGSTRIVYIGDVRPKHLLVDYDLLQVILSDDSLICEWDTEWLHFD